MAVIFFISGNEGNWFEIEMNERTNVGTLKVVKVWYSIILYPIQYFVFLAFFKVVILKWCWHFSQTWIGKRIKITVF